MGQLCSGKNKTKIVRKSYTTRHESTIIKSKTLINQYANYPQSEFWFLIDFSNLKVRNFDDSNTFAIFKILNISHKVVLKQNNGNSTWNSNWNTQIKITKDELLAEKFTFTLFGSNEVKIAELIIDFLDLCIGPSHLDYQTQFLTTKKQNRISIDIKIQHVLNVEITFNQVKCNMKENIKMKGYDFSLKVVSDHTHFNSEHSSTFYNNAYGNEEEGQSPEKLKIVLKKEIEWKESGNVELQLEVPITKLINSSVQFLLWGVETDIQAFSTRKITEMKTGKHVLVGETYIGMNQLIQSEDIDLDNDQKQIKKKEISNKQLWNSGQPVGMFQSNLQLVHDPFICQMLVGVRTEKGIQNNSQQTVRGTSEVKEIQELQSLVQHLVDILFDYLNTDVINKLELELNIREVFKNVSKIINATHKESVKSFVYKNDIELFKAQEIMISLINHLIKNADYLKEELREQYYSALKIVFNRAELNLNSLGFFNNYENIFFKKKNPNSEETQAFTLKNSVALQFQKCLYTNLSIVLDKLSSKSLNNNEREFVENFLAMVYFRIPQLKTKILSSIKIPDDIIVQEWRGTEYALEDEVLKVNSKIDSMFDWDNKFYSFIQQFPDYQENVKELETILLSEEIEKKFSKKGLAFLFFIAEWAQYVQRMALIKSAVPWQEIYGYRTMLKAFLIKMKEIPLIEYSEGLIQSMKNLINNEKLLNIFVLIMLQKSNIYEAQTVIKCFNLISDLLSHLAKLGRDISSQFDHQQFLNGIKIVLTDSDHVQCISTVIQMLYNHYTLFPINLRKDIVQIICSQVGLKHFSHWSHNVRMVYQHFLIFRVYHLHNKKSNIDEEQLQKEYLSAHEPKKIQSYFESKKNQSSITADIIYVMFFRFITYLERIKEQSKILKRKFLFREDNIYKRMKEKMLNKKYNYPDLDQTASALNAEGDQKEEKKKKKEFPEFKPLDEDQLKYVNTSYYEYTQILNQYKGWLKREIQKYGKEINDEDKEIVYSSFILPDLNIQIPHDEREENIGGVEEW